MGSSLLSPFPISFSLLFLSLAFSTIIASSAAAAAADTTTALIYKGCADQKFQDPTGAYSQTLTTLLNTLVTQSSTAKFYKTTTGNGQSAFLGLFQCRGDLTNSECNSCVGKIPDMTQKLCGKAIAARVQLGGCYLRYEVSGFQQFGSTKLLYKICGSGRASGSGFEERLDSALGEVVKGVGSGNGFYAGGFQSVYVLGQCEGDLGSGDCGECVKSAVEQVKSECGSSISGQIYLQQCYISYSYYPSGVPNDKSPPGK